MATLAEIAEWIEGIYQLETGDPVLGGADGIDNLQAKQLAARTKWLKTYLAPLLSPALTGTPTAPTAGLGTNTTQLANTAFVQAAVAALVASSPATLDTLNELAAALGNDPNFATTITNALALKAPLASPALTGTPTAPTAGLGTNTTQLANMAALQAGLDALGNHSLFAASRTANGYQKLPGGLILQWGYVASAATSGTITYPLAFPVAPLFVALTSDVESVSGGDGTAAGVHEGSAPGQTSFQYSSQSAVKLRWLAIGC